MNTFDDPWVSAGPPALPPKLPCQARTPEAVALASAYVEVTVNLEVYNPSPPPPTSQSSSPAPASDSSTPFTFRSSPSLEPASGSSTWPPPPLSPSSSSPPPSPGGISTAQVVGIVIGVVVIAALTCLGFLDYERRRRQNKSMTKPPPLPTTTTPQQQTTTTTPPQPPGTQYFSFDPPQPEDSPPPPSLQLALSLPSTFTREELATATDNFSNANLLGEGGFGYVHKGVLSNGTEVAVKQLKAGSHQGDREFKTEVEIISRVHHRHLVSLVGYSITGSQRMLVYEFVPNHSLEFHLHGEGIDVMSWPTRLKIALGVAKGLAYLHEECNPAIIHHDVKAANILLDINFEAKVSDFGLAKLFPDNDTHISTAVKGTFGYMDPDYFFSRKVTKKSDVFSFGVMLLELVTGRQPINNDVALADWARPLLSRALEDRNFGTLVDPRMQTSDNDDKMVRMVACAASCVCLSAQQRPSMSEVVRALEGNLPVSILIERIPPAHNYDTNQYQKLRRQAFGTPDSGNAECSEPTSRYG